MKGLSLFSIDQDRLAFGIGPRRWGARDVHANEVFLDDYQVLAATIIGAEGQGFTIAGRKPRNVMGVQS